MKLDKICLTFIYSLKSLSFLKYLNVYWDSIMKKRLRVTNWADASLLFSEARIEILDLCAIQPHSIKDLSIAMGLNPGSIHNHVKKLHGAGFLVLVQTRLVNGIEEKKYAKSAEFIDISGLPEEDLPKRNEKIARDVKKEVFQLLERDRHASVRRQVAYLSASDLEYVRGALDELRTYILEHQVPVEEGVSKCTFVYAIGSEVREDGSFS